MAGKKRVAIIFGGQSSEHEVSRVSATSVIKNIDTEKFDIVMIGITKDGRWMAYDGPVDKISTGEWEAIAADGESQRFGTSGILKKGVSVRNIFSILGVESEDKQIDAVFPVMHGNNCEDGTLQGLFELAGIPYVGPGVLGSSLGMDKAYSKIIFDREGIPQGDYRYFTRKEINEKTDYVIGEVEAKFEYPCFVKPSNAGSSVGVSKAHDRKELIEALNFAALYDRKVLVEEFINGREVECAVLGNDEPAASTVGEVIPSSEFYDYEAKYIDNSSETLIPANLETETIEEIRELAVRAFKALDCAGLSRVDFFVHRETGKVYINEINTLPGFTSISMYPKLWEASGLPYGQLIEKLIDLAIERADDNKRVYDR